MWPFDPSNLFIIPPIRDIKWRPQLLLQRFYLSMIPTIIPHTLSVLFILPVIIYIRKYIHWAHRNCCRSLSVEELTTVTNILLHAKNGGFHSWKSGRLYSISSKIPPLFSLATESRVAVYNVDVTSLIDCIDHHSLAYWRSSWLFTLQETDDRHFWYVPGLLLTQYGSDHPCC